MVRRRFANVHCLVSRDFVSMCRMPDRNKKICLTLLEQSQATEMNPVSIMFKTRDSIPFPRMTGKGGFGVLAAFTIKWR